MFKTWEISINLLLYINCHDNCILKLKKKFKKIGLLKLPAHMPIISIS